jgi:hypothetical protein
MDTLDPDDEGMRAMIDELGLAEPDADISVCLLTDLELINRFNAVTQELLALGEVTKQKTEQGRDAHSCRSAYLIELKRRRLR